jgi:hypothetical protein
LAQRRIIQLVFADEGVKAAPVAMMAKLHIWNIIRDGARLPSDGQDLSTRHLEKFRAFIHEARYQPGAGNRVDLRALTGDPFHFAFISPPAVFQPSMPPSMKRGSRPMRDPHIQKE